MLVLIPLIEQLVSLGVTVIPEWITAAQQEIALFATGSPPTADQQAQIDAALAAAHAALQAAQPASA
jgi:hypothetical protein